MQEIVIGPVLIRVGGSVMDKKIMGHINCPVCGIQAGMRITPDKHGQPFGYCEAGCNAQLRIGGNAYRVAQFYRLHPEIAKQATVGAAADTDTGGGGPVTVTVPEETPAPIQQKPARAGFNLGNL